MALQCRTPRQCSWAVFDDLRRKLDDKKLEELIWAAPSCAYQPYCTAASKVETAAVIMCTVVCTRYLLYPSAKEPAQRVDAPQLLDNPLAARSDVMRNPKDVLVSMWKFLCDFVGMQVQEKEKTIKGAE